MKKATAAVGILVTAVAGYSTAALAANMRDPDEVRWACEKRGDGKSVEALKRCCASLLVVPPDSNRQKLEAQCVKGQEARPADTARKK